MACSFILLIAIIFSFLLISTDDTNLPIQNLHQGSIPVYPYLFFDYASSFSDDVVLSPAPVTEREGIRRRRERGFDRRGDRRRYSSRADKSSTSSVNDHALFQRVNAEIQGTSFSFSSIRSMAFYIVGVSMVIIGFTLLLIGIFLQDKAYPRATAIGDGGLSNDHDLLQSGEFADDVEEDSAHVEEYPRRAFAEPNASSHSSPSSQFHMTLVYPPLVTKDTASDRTILTGLPATDFSQLPSSSSSSSSSSSHVEPETPHNFSQLPHHPVIDQNEMAIRNEPLKLGKTNIGLTFQATLALMLFHFEGSPPSFSTSMRSMSFNIVGVSMVIGFTSSLIGISLRSAYPRAATIGDYLGMFSTTFGFFMMIQMFLPESFSWTVWPACVFVFLAFVLAYAKTRGAGRIESAA